ncbi:MAG: hypothetical protein M5U28_14695 [Sandaracinaceae bacterium]|nr:hypothetical protein [Sandaracinaceae bacterium]
MKHLPGGRGDHGYLAYLSGRGRVRCADYDLLAPIAVQIANVGESVAESSAGILALEHRQELSARGRDDEHRSPVVAEAAFVKRRPDEEVASAVSVLIANRRNFQSEARRRSLERA